MRVLHSRWLWLASCPGSLLGPVKEWHNFVMADLRNQLVHKHVEALIPKSDQSPMLDSRMRNLMAYAKKVKGYMYAMRSGYDHLHGQKI